MTETEVVEILRTSLNELLRWVGFGTLTGLARYSMVCFWTTSIAPTDSAQ